MMMLRKEKREERQSNKLALAANDGLANAVAAARAHASSPVPPIVMRPRFRSATAAVVLGNRRAWSHDVWLATRRLVRAHNHSLFDFAGHSHERLLDIGGVLGRRFEKWNTEAVCKLLRLLVVDDALRDEIALVANKQFVDIFARIAINLLQPLAHVVERHLVGDVVHDNDAVRAAVIRRRNSAEALLACCVPDLQLDHFSLQLDRADFLCDIIFFC